jgi:spore coat protein U-like protein
VTVTCVTLVSTPETFTVKLSTGGSGSYTRQMTSGAAHLNYKIYTDSARSSIWGDGTGGTSYNTISSTIQIVNNNKNFKA